MISHEISRPFFFGGVETRSFRVDQKRFHLSGEALGQLNFEMAARLRNPWLAELRKDPQVSSVTLAPLVVDD